MKAITGATGLGAIVGENCLENKERSQPQKEPQERKEGEKQGKEGLVRIFEKF